MSDEDKFLYWINREIPDYLDKFSCFSEFEANVFGACASVNWKRVAFAMAKERWNVSRIEHIPA